VRGSSWHYIGTVRAFVALRGDVSLLPAGICWQGLKFRWPLAAGLKTLKCSTVEEMVSALGFDTSGFVNVPGCQSVSLSVCLSVCLSMLCYIKTPTHLAAASLPGATSLELLLSEDSDNLAVTVCV